MQRMTVREAEASFGCWLDSARGVYIGEEVQKFAQDCGWEDELIPCDHQRCDGLSPDNQHEEIEHGDFYPEAAVDAEDWLNGVIAPEGYFFGHDESGDWGLWPTDETFEELERKGLV